MSKIPVIYLAGALRGTKEQKRINMERAQWWSEILWRSGFAVYSPHLNSGWLDTPETDVHVIPANIQLMKMCDIMCVMPFFESSKGTQEEIKVCIESKIPVMHLDINQTNDFISETILEFLKRSKNKELEC
jgi:nucleoside 2-deoxyribosyltransferase